MSIQIITDSGCDILPIEADKMGITVLPLKVFFNEKEYKDGIDFTHEEFYTKLIEDETLPTSSQVCPSEYQEVFEKETAKGNEVICITISSQLSGCMQSAVIASEDYTNISIVDSLNVCIGQRILVEYAKQLATSGLDRQTIVEKLEFMKHKVKILALMDTLEYLKKGGRITAVAAAAGEILSIKPVISMDHDGTIKVVGKARGSKNGNNLLNKLVQEEGGINFNLPFAVSYSGLSDVLVTKYLNDSKHIYESEVSEIPLYTIGSAVGTHAGPGAIAVAFFVN